MRSALLGAALAVMVAVTAAVGALPAPAVAAVEADLAARTDATGCDTGWLTWAVAPYLPLR